MPQAQVRGCPDANGFGRLREREAVIARARSRYLPVRWSPQNASVSATTWQLSRFRFASALTDWMARVDSPVGPARPSRGSGRHRRSQGGGTNGEGRGHQAATD